jgi:CRP/FNR family transcriptional regulator, anaerobic regulatory protein
MTIPAPLLSPAATLQSGVISIRDLRTYCSKCSVRQLCLPVGLDADTLQEFDRLAKNRVRLKKGDALYRAGDAFSALYAIRMGSCKTTVLSEDGHEQVAGYHITGDMLGMDGIGAERYGCEAIALEDSECCVLPFGELGDLTRSAGPLQRNLYQVLSREIARSQSIMLLLGSMRAEERLAAFLLNLSQRYRERGYSSTEFVLRMSRQEIGSYIGLKLETVSRLFSRFQQEGLIQVQGRSIKLLDIPTLKQLMGQHA